MTYTIETLSGLSFTDLYHAFMEAFADYIQDASHVTEESFTNRAIKNGVNLALSAGAYADGKLVGFTLVGIDQFYSARCAFDAGTGIIKPYRGKGIAKAMFDFLAPSLREIGVKHFILEVLTENVPAIKAYQKAGFRVSRALDSFQLRFEDARLDPDPDAPIQIAPIEKCELPLYQSFFDWQPSWENSLPSIARIPDEVTLLGASYQGARAGILVYYPMLNWILCLAVKKTHRRREIATHLLAYLQDSIAERVPKVRIINIDHSDSGMIAFLEHAGFQYTFNQYEMEMALVPASGNTDTLPVRHYNAAGGVVVHEDKVLVLERPSRGEVRLPKGHIESGESAAEAALREVGEESGYPQLHIMADLGTQTVEFEHQGFYFVRAEQYFLMRLEGDLRTSGEVEFEPQWLPWETALEKLSFPAEKEWIRRAMKIQKSNFRIDFSEAAD